MTPFGAYLRELRQARKLSRPQVRDHIRDRFGDSFSTSSLENWENGKAYPPAPDLAKLIVILDADYEEVFSRLVAETRPDVSSAGHDSVDVAPRQPRGSSRVHRGTRGGGGARQRRSGSGSSGR